MQAGEEHTKINIAFMDDDLLTLKSLRLVLESEGYAVSTFSDAQRALKRTDEKCFDLVINDVRMPGLDGYAVLEKIMSRFPSSEIIFITGCASLEGAVDAANKGVYQYLEKPFSPDN